MRSTPILATLACIVLAGCGGGERPRDAAARAPAGWRGVITDADRDRLRDWRTAWAVATAQVRASGQGAALIATGALFEPDRAMTAPLPPAGAYRCRTFKLGARSAGMPAYTAYPAFACRIARDGDVVRFVRDGGSQRPIGTIYDDGAARAIFLGTLVLGDESAPLRYGQDRARDVVGVVERIGDRRWRMILPYPAFESTLDVIELVSSA